MALWRNKSHGPITFYDPRNAFQQRIAPGHVVSDSDYPNVDGHPDFERVSDFWTFIHTHPGANVAVVRSYALGDVLMVYAILNTITPVLDEHDISITLFTQKRFMPVFAYTKDSRIRWSVDDKLAMIPEVQRQYDVAFSLNGILERDHVASEHDQENRLHMLAHALGCEKVVQT